MRFTVGFTEASEDLDEKGLVELLQSRLLTSQLSRSRGPYAFL